MIYDSANVYYNFKSVHNDLLNASDKNSFMERPCSKALSRSLWNDDCGAVENVGLENELIFYLRISRYS